jgi:DNA-binding LacI/PurR family transcriptional regulator
LSRTTIKDIANALGINASTVSRALKDHPDIGKPLKEKIQAVAEDLGYMPNQFASNLRSGRTFTIGLIVPEISIFFFPSVMKAVEELTHDNGYRLLILHSSDKLEIEAESAKICAKYGVDGVLVSLSRQTVNLDHFRCLTDNKVPIVFYDKVPDRADTYNISFDNEAAARNAVQHLLSAEKKPKRFAGIFGDKKLALSNTRGRLKGFKECLQENGYTEKDYDIVFADTVAEAAEVSRQLFSGENKPDAIVTMGDDRLLGTSKTLLEMGLKIPENISMISLSDGFLTSTLAFKIPFVLTSGYEMGKIATALLFDLIERRVTDPESTYVETPVILD